jgi:hypothetical protein
MDLLSFTMKATAGDPNVESGRNSGKSDGEHVGPN